ncbi:hypothetical protein FA15DRAFT_586636 [Coprinopsis marcescibilis]|uniref:MYND-type domain-containing protein n=1 Tax=Coprinopsis marcescibilis TaxID=230819 RepID=A0A5C3L2K5_COPMA|nr:hypothetical protein FA15DRAFT_586636 [Coprinopsis marcescibilis]
MGRFLNLIFDGQDRGSERIPPIPSNLGQACYKCYAEESHKVALSTCGNCKRIAYCSTGCQKNDWRAHMPVCNALKALECSENSFQMAMLSGGIILAGANPGLRKDFIKRLVLVDISDFEACLLQEGSTLGSLERGLFLWEPRCTVCGITDRMIRVLQRSSSPTASDHQPTSFLYPCSTCKTTFFCSPTHELLGTPSHTQHKQSSGCSTFTQCQLNQRLRESIRLKHALATLALADVNIVWVPDRVKQEWTSLRGRNWEDEFLEDAKEAISVLIPATRDMPHPVNAFLRAASEALSVPMTILWALEVMNGKKVEWRRKDTLRIHIIDASEMEFQAGRLMEEILHRLPEIRAVEFTLFGQGVADVKTEGPHSAATNLPFFRDCRRRGRQVIRIYSSECYPEFVQRIGPTLLRPDLATVFNSDSGLGNVRGWRKTMKLLAKMRVPFAFTAYTQEQAKIDAKEFKKAGGKLCKELQPRVNPWGSLELEPGNGAVGSEIHFTANGWIAGGLR